MPPPTACRAVVAVAIVVTVVAVAIVVARRRSRPPCERHVVLMDGPEFSGLYVYTVTTTMDHSGLHRLAGSVARAGGRLRVVHVPGDRIGRLPVGYGPKVLRMAECCACHADDDLFCFVDAFDVLVAAPLTEMVAAYRALAPGRLLFGAEMGCWPVYAPYDEYCPRFESQTPPQRYRFLNSGGYMGPCGLLRDLVRRHGDRLQPPPVDDQAFFGGCLLDGEAITLDLECRVFQNLIAHGVPGDLEWDAAAGRWRNRHTGTTPLVLHGNGPASARELLFDVMGPPLGV